MCNRCHIGSEETYLVCEMITPEEAKRYKTQIIRVLNSNETRERSEEFNRNMCHTSEKDLHRPFTI